MTKRPPEVAPTVTESAPHERPSDGRLSVEELWVELRLRRRTVHPINGVTLSVERGETLGLVGESGSGKSMLALTVMGLLPQPFSKVVDGRIRLGDTDVLALNESAMRRVRGAQMSMVFQEPMTALDPLFTVGDQISEAVRAHREVSREGARELAVAMLERVGIASPAKRIDSYPHELSGGMRQRVGIARALAVDPAVLLMDEPFSALDAQTRQLLQEELLGIWERTRKTILYVTHNIREAVWMADRVVVLSRRPGRVLDVVPVELKRPRTEAMLGEPALLHAVERIWGLVKSQARAALQEGAA
jgi:ABC-type dipeptide/oligopeptide/nickel transport system ATPase component